MAEWFENLVNKDYLQDNLTFASLFIALYENMTDYVVSSVRDFLCDIGIRDGKMFCEETDEYRREIRKRVVNDKGNRDTTKASFLWLIDHGAITSADFDRFLQIKQVRNKYAHKLSEVITTGIAESEVALLFDMHSLYRKISGWFFVEIEAPIIGYDVPPDADVSNIQSGANVMFSDGHETKVKDNPLNENFAKKEFQALWREINHKYAYTVDFDSAELIRNAIAHIDKKLFVSELQYTTTIGRQKAEMNEYEIERGDSFTGEKTRTQTLKHAEASQIKYDLIGKIAEGTVLTRRTVSAILQGIRVDKLYMFRNNPEEFISKVIRLINEQKATMIVEHISYDTIEGEYDSSIFTAEKATQSFDKAFLAKKAIQDYVFTDGSADKSIERKFAEDLDAAEEVCVYAKLPRTFQIPTPVGNYSPDWAIAFYEGTVKHIFFIAETKGTMESLELRPIEQAKISCAKKLFNEMSTSNVVYHDVDSYRSLLSIMNSI